jgi:hypothetical protein
MNDSEKIKRALHIADSFGTYDGDHHKMWVIDQMVRVLTDCPLVTKTAKDYNGVSFSYEALGESDAYNEFVRQHKDGEDGADTYSWDIGVPP